MLSAPPPPPPSGFLLGTGRRIEQEPAEVAIAQALCASMIETPSPAQTTVEGGEGIKLNEQVEPEQYGTETTDSGQTRRTCSTDCLEICVRIRDMSDTEPLRTAS